ncbi:MAG TPA: MarR family transcriptional regulator [Actinomycetota bacterium]|nr:MarR family transcriptional regulator [Actinomycetota bacterium]
MATSRRTSPARRQADVEAVADRLHSAAIHLLRRLRVEDDALGVSAPRLSVLSVLVFAGPRRIGELARIEQVEPPTMTRLVDGLVRDGLALREPDPDDARAVRVRATATGARTLRRGRARRVETLRRALDALPSRDLTALGDGVDVLERVLGDR